MLDKKSRCFKYRKQGYITTDMDVFCKSQATILDQKLILDLKAIELQTNSQSHISDLEN